MVMPKPKAVRTRASTDTSAAVDEFMATLKHSHADARENSSVNINDPERLLTWLAQDRAMVSFTGLKEVLAHKGALQSIVRQWIKFV